MNQKEIFSYYSREDIQNEIIRLSKNREVIGMFRTGSYGERPNTIIYPNDIIAMVRTGMVEFHFSLEHWSNPLLVKQSNYDSLRSGFDIIFDFDCEYTEHGKIAAKLFIKELKKHGIKNTSLKFSGGTGFHVGIPWKSLPREVDYKKTEKSYPELPRTIVSYLKSKVRNQLEKELMKIGEEKLSEQTGKHIKDFITDTGIDPYKIVDIDPILISPRHLVRMPYSLNSKRFLVSLPLKISELDDFKPEDAKPEKVKVKERFLVDFEEDEAELLISEAIDWQAHVAKKEMKYDRKKLKFKKAVPLDFAPPCIKNIMKGMLDGKKRSVFILINYLSTLGWSKNEIEKVIFEWNNKNEQPLRENYIIGQLRYHKKSISPPNCVKQGYYTDMGICKPDNICGGEKKLIKNPVNYALKIMSKKRGSK